MEEYSKLYLARHGQVVGFEEMRALSRECCRTVIQYPASRNQKPVSRGN